jgi:hypothetical protein
LWRSSRCRALRNGEARRGEQAANQPRRPRVDAGQRHDQRAEAIGDGQHRHEEAHDAAPPAHIRRRQDAALAHREKRRNRKPRRKAHRHPTVPRLGQGETCLGGDHQQDGGPHQRLARNPCHDARHHGAREEEAELPGGRVESDGARRKTIALHRHRNDLREQSGRDVAQPERRHGADKCGCAGHAWSYAAPTRNGDCPRVVSLVSNLRMSGGAARWAQSGRSHRRQLMPMGVGSGAFKSRPRL